MLTLIGKEKSALAFQKVGENTESLGDDNDDVWGVDLPPSNGYISPFACPSPPSPWFKIAKTFLWSCSLFVFSLTRFISWFVRCGARILLSKLSCLAIKEKRNLKDLCFNISTKTVWWSLMHMWLEGIKEAQTIWRSVCSFLFFRSQLNFF